MPLNSLVTVQRGDSCGRIAKNLVKTVAQNTVLRSEIFWEFESVHNWGERKNSKADPDFGCYLATVVPGRRRASSVA
jgi:hypothetical protein